MYIKTERIRDDNDKYNAWLAFMTSAILAANYTENGWGLTRAPEHITKQLQERLYSSLGVAKTVERTQCYANGEDCVNNVTEILEPIHGTAKKEHFIKTIEGEDHARPIMIGSPGDNINILHEMQPLFEWWSGLDLIPSIAYGIRAYRNDSNLLMHIDKAATHIISGIFHVDRSDDAKPWPIVIEDFLGNTNQVYLAPGDLLFYESSKCFHGRPQTFIGSYYASIFLHYRPVDYVEIEKEQHYAVPEHWRQTKPSMDGLEELVVKGTGMKEPECKNLLCSLDENNEQSKYTVSWTGPAIKGQIVTNGWDPVTMTPPKDWINDDGGRLHNNGGKGDVNAAMRVLDFSIEDEL